MSDKKKLMDPMNNSFHAPSGTMLRDVNSGVAKETSHNSNGKRPGSDYRPKAPSVKGKLGCC